MLLRERSGMAEEGDESRPEYDAVHLHRLLTKIQAWGRGYVIRRKLNTVNVQALSRHLGMVARHENGFDHCLTLLLFICLFFSVVWLERNINFMAGIQDGLLKEVEAVHFNDDDHLTLYDVRSPRDAMHWAQEFMVEHYNGQNESHPCNSCDLESMAKWAEDCSCGPPAGSLDPDLPSAGFTISDCTTFCSGYDRYCNNATACANFSAANAAGSIEKLELGRDEIDCDLSSFLFDVGVTPSMVSFLNGLGMDPASDYGMLGLQSITIGGGALLITVHERHTCGAHVSEGLSELYPTCFSREVDGPEGFTFPLSSAFPYIGPDQVVWDPDLQQFTSFVEFGMYDLSYANLCQLLSVEESVLGEDDTQDSRRAIKSLELNVPLYNPYVGPVFTSLSVVFSFPHAGSATANVDVSSLNAVQPYVKPERYHALVALQVAGLVVWILLAWHDGVAMHQLIRRTMGTVQTDRTVLLAKTVSSVDDDEMDNFGEDISEEALRRRASAKAAKARRERLVRSYSSQADAERLVSPRSPRAPAVVTAFSAPRAGGVGEGAFKANNNATALDAAAVSEGGNHAAAADTDGQQATMRSVVQAMDSKASPKQDGNGWSPLKRLTARKKQVSLWAILGGVTAAFAHSIVVVLYHSSLVFFVAMTFRVQGQLKQLSVEKDLHVSDGDLRPVVDILADFALIVADHELADTVMIIFATIALARLFIIVSFHKRLAFVTKTIASSLSNLLHLGLMLALALVTFSAITWTLFGVKLHSFRTFGASFVSLLSIIFGLYDTWTDLSEAGGIIGLVIIFFFEGIIVLLLFNILLSVVLQSYETSEELVAHEEPLPESLFVYTARKYERLRRFFAHAYTSAVACFHRNKPSTSAAEVVPHTGDEEAEGKMSPRPDAQAAERAAKRKRRLEELELWAHEFVPKEKAVEKLNESALPLPVCQQIVNQLILKSLEAK